MNKLFFIISLLLFFCSTLFAQSKSAKYGYNVEGKKATKAVQFQPEKLERDYSIVQTTPIIKKDRNVTVLEKNEDTVVYQVDMSGLSQTELAEIQRKFSVENRKFKKTTTGKATITLAGFDAKKITAEDLNYFINNINRFNQ